MKRITYCITILSIFLISGLKLNGMEPENLQANIYTMTIYNKMELPVKITLSTGKENKKLINNELLPASRDITIDFPIDKNVWPIRMQPRSITDQDLFIYDHVTKRMGHSISIKSPPTGNLVEWTSGQSPYSEIEKWAGDSHAIPIYLVKQKGKDRIDAFSYDKYRDFLKRETQVKRVSKAPINLKEALEIEPGSIQEKVFVYAQIPSSLDTDIVKNTTLTDEEKQKKQRYRNIDSIIKETNNFEDLKKLVLMQLNMALFIVDHISFIDVYESLVEENYPPQERLPSPSDKYKTQWLSVLLDIKQGDFLKFPSHLSNTLKITKLAIVLERIRNLLLDIGFSPSNNPLETLDDIKRAISENFRLLFENLFIVRNVKPSGTLKKLLLPKKVISLTRSPR